MRERLKHEEHFLRSAIALSRGDWYIAAQEAAAGSAIADGHGAIQGRLQNLALLAMSLALKGDGSASAAIDELAQVGRDTKNRVPLLQAALASSTLAHATRRWKAFEAAWGDVTRLSLATGIRALPGVNADAVGRLARDALLRGVKHDETVLLIRAWRLLPPAGEPASTPWPYHLEVNCLARNEIEITTFAESGRRVPVGARPKTASLLTLLAAADSRGLPRTTLVAELWPEAE